MIKGGRRWVEDRKEKEGGGIRGLRRQSDTIIFFFQQILSISFV